MINSDTLPYKQDAATLFSVVIAWALSCGCDEPRNDDIG